MTLQDKILSYLESNGRIAWGADVCRHLYGEGFTRSHRETLRQTAGKMEEKGLLFSGAFFAIDNGGAWFIPDFLDATDAERMNGKLLLWLPGVMAYRRKEGPAPLEAMREKGSQRGGRLSGSRIRFLAASALLEWNDKNPEEVSPGVFFCREIRVLPGGEKLIDLYTLRGAILENRRSMGSRIHTEGVDKTRWHVAIMRAIHRFKDEGLVTLWYKEGHTRMPSWVEVKDIEGLHRYAEQPTTRKENPE